MISIGVTILVAVLSSFSALAATYLNNKSNEARLTKQAELDRYKDREKLRLEKCEYLYLELVKWKNFIFSLHMDWILLVDGYLTLSELNAKISKDKNIHELQASLGVYFPTLKKDFLYCQEQLKPANAVLFDIRDGKKINKEASRVIILDSGAKFDNAVDNLLKKLSAIANFN